MNLNKTEHFVTLFDSNFLPMGMCLHSSLMQHAQPFHLWILCMDETVKKQLFSLQLPDVTLVSLNEVETKELLSAKSGRSRGEYCWTLTPFTPQIVFDRLPDVDRATYVDSDMFFFDDPRILLNELDKSCKHVLITEHAYDPRYDKSFISGKFCVQFITFYNTPQGHTVMKWWQDRCLEWCFARYEDGKLGDQKYLDCWPQLFGDAVHVLQQTDKTLAPWNASYIANRLKENLSPVFYHFHGLSIISPKHVRLYSGYKISLQAFSLYEEYMFALRNIVARLGQLGIKTPFTPRQKLKWHILRSLKNKIMRLESEATL